MYRSDAKLQPLIAIKNFKGFKHLGAGGGGDCFYEDGLSGWASSRAELAPTKFDHPPPKPSDLHHLIRLAARFLDHQVDEVQFGDDGRGQDEGVEVWLTHAA